MKHVSVGGGDRVSAFEMIGMSRPTSRAGFNPREMFNGP